MKRPTLLAVACLSCLAVPAVPQGAPDKFPDPTPRKEAILKTFAGEFVPLTPGTGKFPKSFLLGSPKAGYPSEKPARKVTFDHSFAMAKYEVTQELYHVVTGGNPSKWKGLRNAVELITWQEAVDFCRTATKLLRERKLIGGDEEIRLPSEAEWEYACRAGTTTAFSWGGSFDDIDPYCWYRGNSKGYDPPVGKKEPNPWGLYDMHGYNWEWVADAWAEDLKKHPTDGSALTGGKAEARVIRGGSWADPADWARSAFRRGHPAASKNDTIGFRCVKAKVK